MQPTEKTERLREIIIEMDAKIAKAARTIIKAANGELISDTKESPLEIALRLQRRIEDWQAFKNITEFTLWQMERAIN